MYYVYVLQSLKDKELYIGFTADLRSRVLRHNKGLVISTKSRIPFVLAYYEAYKDKKDATKREYFLKTHQQRELLRERIKNSLQ